MYIWILNENLRREHILQKFNNFIWNTAFQEAGNFEIKCGVEKFDLFLDWEDEDKTIFIEYTLDPWHVGVVEVVEKVEEEDGEKYLNIKGRTAEEAILRRRVSEYIIPFQNAYSGDIAKRLMYENFINPTKTQRKMEQIVQGMTEEEIVALGKRKYMECGVEVNIYEHLKELALNAEIGFRLEFKNINELDRKLGLVMYEGIDRTINNDPADGNERVIVGQRRGIANRIDFYQDTTEKGTAIVANLSGEEIGDSGDMLFYPGDITSEDDGGTGLRRFEKPFTFSDLSRTYEDEEGNSYDIPEEDVKENAYSLMHAYLGKVQTKKCVTGQLPPHEQRNFRKKYNLGDKVTVIDDETGYAVDSTVMSAQEIISVSGYSVNVDIGERSPITDTE